MRSLGVVPIEVLGDVGASSAHAVVGHEVHAFVLYATPQPFDKHVVAPGTSPVHRQLDAFAQHRVGKFLGRELTTLIRVDDLRHTVPSEGFLDDLPGMTRLQRDGDFVRQDPATGNVHDRRQVHEAFGHGNVGRVQRPDLVGATDVQLAQQVGVDLVARSGLARAGLRRQRFNAHAAHERADVASSNMNVLTRQLVAQHARAHERMLQVQLIDATHERQIGLTHGLGQVVHPSHDSP